MDIRPGYFVMSMSSVALFAVALFAELGTRHPKKKKKNPTLSHGKGSYQEIKFPKPKKYALSAQTCVHKEYCLWY